MQKVVIFDFDGTIADTFSCVVSIVNDLSGEYGFSPLGIEEIAALRHKRAQDVLSIFTIPLWKIPSFILTVKERLGDQIRTVSPFNGIIDALELLKKEGFTLGILSSNEMSVVDSFLEFNGITLFDFVYCEKDLFGKARVLTHLMQKHSFDVSHVIYVGDETRDIEAAHKAHIKIVSVGWGFNSVTTLEKSHPDVLIEKPHELYSALDSLFPL